MNKSIILSLDYEIYGNGQGDVFEHIITPTEKILKTVERSNAKLTVFFEVVEYWKLKEEWEKGNHMGYHQNPIAAIEKQLREIHQQGHDIQLHIHPQWIDAQWLKNRWQVNLEKWRLGDYQGEGKESLTFLLKRGKDTIEQIINDKYYKCKVLRAGGYNIQPSEALIKTMKEVGLRADSSIYPGGKEQGILSRYDYTSIAYDVGMWYCDRSLEEHSIVPTDIIELPIVAFPIIRFQKYLSNDRIWSLLRNRKSAKETFTAKVSNEKGKIRSKIQYFFQKESQTWDYCLFSKSMHKQFLHAISHQKERKIFVLVGHPKNFVSDRGLKYLLKKTEKDYSYTTISNILLQCGLIF